jgi:hypothetical protein
MRRCHPGPFALNESMTDLSRRRLMSSFVGAFCLPRTRLALAVNSEKASAKGLAAAISSEVNSGASDTSSISASAQPRLAEAAVFFTRPGNES